MYIFYVTSAILASISVVLRNFALSTLFQNGLKDIIIGNKKYEDILVTSAKIATGTGIVFIANTILALIIAFRCVASTQSDLYPLYVLTPLFVIGIILILICLIFGHLNYNIPKKVKTEEAK